VFDDVPERLSQYIKETPLDFYRANRDMLYLTAAGGVTAEYLHKNFFDPTNEDPFIDKRKINEAGDYWFGYPQRIMLIGETLF